MSDKQNPYALDVTRNERQQKVVRSVYLIQHAQYTLSLSEQRFLLYCISKVQPDDHLDKIYEIQLKDYLQVCGLRGTTSYSAIKEQVVETMRQMVLGMEELDEKGRKTFTVYNWFSKMSVTQGTGLISFRFSPDIAQHLIGLAQYNAQSDKANQLYYISDELKYMLPFKCRYSYYLYPLLRSYQNRNEWTFKLEDLRRQLDVYERMDNPADYEKSFDPKSNVKRKPIHQRFADFRRSVLDPAVDDINKYSNIKCAYRVEKRGQTVVAITFIYENKNELDRLQSAQRGMLILDRTDDFTQQVNRDVPDPELPLEFAEAVSTGEDTNPPSKRVKKKTETELRKESIDRIRGHFTGADSATEEQKTVPFGKRGSRAANKEKQELNVDHYFPVDRGAKTGIYLWKIEDAKEHAGLVGGSYGDWGKDMSARELALFVTHAIKYFGAIRLREALTDGKVKIQDQDYGVMLSIKGKTPALDMSKFVHRMFGDREEILRIFDDFCEN